MTRAKAHRGWLFDDFLGQECEAVVSAEVELSDCPGQLPSSDKAKGTQIDDLVLIKVEIVHLSC